MDYSITKLSQSSKLIKKKFLFKADPYFKLHVFFLSQPMNKTDPSLKQFYQFTNRLQKVVK